MFNIHIHNGSEPVPDDDICYIIAKDGIFLKKKLGLFESVAPVQNISILKEIESFARMDITKLSINQTGQLVSFFKYICYDYGEANAVLHYNIEDETYKIQVTEQEVTGASVDYVNEPFEDEGYQRIGTIHSHAGMSAFHSGTDHADEETFDGLHITFGNLKNENITISASIMANGKRFYIDPCDYLDGIEMVEYDEITKMFYQTRSEKKIGYKILSTKEQSIFPDEWLTKVKKKQFKSYPISTRNQLFIDRFKDFKDLDINESDNIVSDDDWNPCMNCPHKAHKSEIMLQEILTDMDDDELDQLGFVEIDDKGENKTWNPEK